MSSLHVSSPIQTNKPITHISITAKSHLTTFRADIKVVVNTGKTYISTHDRHSFRTQEIFVEPHHEGWMALLIKQLLLLDSTRERELPPKL